jgi:hypothetical protein
MGLELHIGEKTMHGTTTGETKTGTTNGGATGNFFPHKTEKWVNEIFTYHAPTENQIPKYEKLRNAAKTFALTIIETTPSGADQTAALRKLREAVMTANSAIALEGTDFT